MGAANDDYTGSRRFDLLSPSVFKPSDRGDQVVGKVANKNYYNFELFIQSYNRRLDFDFITNSTKRNCIIFWQP